MVEDNKKQQQFLGFKCNPTRVIQYLEKYKRKLKNDWESFVEDRIVTWSKILRKCGTYQVATATILNTWIKVKKHLPKPKNNVKIIKNWSEVFGCLSYGFITGNWFPHIVWFNYSALDHKGFKWKCWFFVKTIWLELALCLAKNI